MKHGLLIATALMLSSMGLTGCESKDDAKLAKAQQCLDKATPTTAESCSAMIAGIESQKAYMIRCGAIYVKNGFVGERIASAFERIKENPTGGADPMATAFSSLSFTSIDEANLAQTYCTASGIRSMERLATFTGMATLIFVNGLGTVPSEPITDPAQINQAITNVVNIINAGGAAAEATATQLGQLAISAEDSYCGEGSSFKTNKVCTDLSAAVAAGGGNTTEIAKQLLTLLQSN